MHPPLPSTVLSLPTKKPPQLTTASLWSLFFSTGTGFRGTYSRVEADKWHTALDAQCAVRTHLQICHDQHVNIYTSEERPEPETIDVAQILERISYQTLQTDLLRHYFVRMPCSVMSRSLRQVMPKNESISRMLQSRKNALGLYCIKGHPFSTVSIPCF